MLGLRPQGSGLQQGQTYQGNEVSRFSNSSRKLRKSGPRSEDLDFSTSASFKKSYGSSGSIYQGSSSVRKHFQRVLDLNHTWDAVLSREYRSVTGDPAVLSDYGRNV